MSDNATLVTTLSKFEAALAAADKKIRALEKKGEQDEKGGVEIILANIASVINIQNCMRELRRKNVSSIQRPGNGVHHGPRRSCKKIARTTRWNDRSRV